jgi:hypothetical protein
VKDEAWACKEELVSDLSLSFSRILDNILFL